MGSCWDVTRQFCRVKTVQCRQGTLISSGKWLPACYVLYTLLTSADPKGSLTPDGRGNGAPSL